MDPNAQTNYPFIPVQDASANAGLNVSPFVPSTGNLAVSDNKFSEPLTVADNTTEPLWSTLKAKATPSPSNLPWTGPITAAPAAPTTDSSKLLSSGTMFDVAKAKKAPSQYASIIDAAASKYGVSPQLLTAIIYQESGFNPTASNVTDVEDSHGFGQINLKAHPDVTLQQANNPSFAVDWMANRLSGMIKKHGIYEGVQAYNTEGAIGKPNLQTYANNILAAAGYTPQNYQGNTNLNPATANASSIQWTSALEPSNINQLFSQVGTKTTDWGEGTRYESSHPGIDLANKAGTQIPSLTSGTVTRVITGQVHGAKGFGNQVEITDQFGNKHRYSHLLAPEVKVGDKVTKGEDIGEMGSSGSTYSPSGKGEGTHLDYRIVSAANTYLNPYIYLNSFYKVAS